MSDKVDHSPLPWTFTYFTKPDGSEITSPQDVADTVAFSALQCEGTQLWGVTLDDKDENGRALVICYTGNGPHSEANARLIAAAVNSLNITRPSTPVAAQGQDEELAEKLASALWEADAWWAKNHKRLVETADWAECVLLRMMPKLRETLASVAASESTELVWDMTSEREGQVFRPASESTSKEKS